MHEKKKRDETIESSDTCCPPSIPIAETIGQSDHSGNTIPGAMDEMENRVCFKGLIGSKPRKCQAVLDITIKVFTRSPIPKCLRLSP